MDSRSEGLPMAKGRLSTREKQTKQNRGMCFMIIARHSAMTADRRRDVV
jgi:hypothetical protein